MMKTRKAMNCFGFTAYKCYVGKIIFDGSEVPSCLLFMRCRFAVDLLNFAVLDKSTSSTSEIASCSYEARSFGVKNGMWLGNARKLCPHLVCAPYEFEEYRRVSQQLYEIIASYTHQIQAVSCDECFADLSDYMESGKH